MKLEKEKADSILSSLYTLLKIKVEIIQGRLDEYEDNIANIEERLFGNLKLWCEKWADNVNENIKNICLTLTQILR